MADGTHKTDLLSIPKVGARVACEIIGCSYQSITNPPWRKRHKIPTYRIGKSLIFCPVELQAWLNNRREQPLPSENEEGAA